MNKGTILLRLSLLYVSCLFTFNVYALDTLYVAGPVGFLSDVIIADTLSDGTHNPDRVYLLDQDAVYLVTSIIQNIGYPLRIVGAEGNGKPPIIQKAPISGNVGRLFSPKDDLLLKNIYITNVDVFGAEGTVAIQPSQDSLRIEMDNMVFDLSTWIFIRNETNHSTYIFRNCLFKNYQNINNASLSNGKPWDNRSGHLTDSLIFENNTFLNMVGNVASSWDQNLKYFRFVHNTVVNEAKFPFGYTRHVEAYITDNIFHNAMFFGNTQLPGGNLAQVYVDSSVTPWDTTGYRYRGLLAIDSLNPGVYSEDDRIMVWERNSVSYSQGIKDFWAASIDYDAPTALFDDSTMQWFDQHPGMSFADTFSIVPEFTNLPANEDSILAYLQDFADLKARGIPTTPIGDFRVYGDSLNHLPWPLMEDLSYPTSSPLYTAAKDGGPLGDRRWFPEFVVGISPDDVKQAPRMFELSQNYPNPFNPATTINFVLHAPEKVKLKIYNVIGQEVSTLINEQMKAGSHAKVWNGMDDSGNRVGSGVYFYKLEVNKQSSVKKMVLIK